MPVKPRSFEEFHHGESGALKREFGKSNPDYWTQLQGRPDDIARARQIIAHTKEAESVLIESFQEEREQRIAEMAVEVWKDRTKQHHYVAPEVAAHLMSESSIREEAAKRVDEIHQRDLANLRDNETESLARIAEGKHQRGQVASQKEIENMTEQEKATHFKAELHKLVDDSNEARVQVSKIMNQERARMIQEAKDRSAEDPIKEVSAFQGRMYRDVQDKLHGDIHALCVKYGYSADQQQVAFYAENPETDAQSHQNGHEEADNSVSELGAEDDSAASQTNQIDDQEP